MKKIAVFPGSFDPVTLGHVEIVKRALPLFDEIIVAIGQNMEKKTLFSIDQRRSWLLKAFAFSDKISLDVCHDLTADYCKEKGANFIIRGLRSTADYEVEKSIAIVNSNLQPGLETIFLMGSPNLEHISSRMVKDVFFHRGNVKPFLPEGVVLQVI